MIRIRLAVVAVALSVVACARPRPLVAPAPAFPASFTFAATSPPDSAMQGTFEGSATYAAGWLTVHVPKATITLPPGNSENWRNLTVRAFLATDYGPADWKAVAQSRPVNVFRFMPLGSTRWSERRVVPLEQALTFTVPVPPGAVATTSRLAFELEWVFVLGSFGDTDSRIAFSGPIPPPGK